MNITPRYGFAYILVIVAYLAACWYFETAVPVAVGFLLGCVGQMILEARNRAETAASVEILLAKIKEQA